MSRRSQSKGGTYGWHERYIERYNHVRLHDALKRHTPGEEVYPGEVKIVA